MADLYRVTVVAEADDPIDDDQAQRLVERFTAALDGEVDAQPADDPLLLRSDRRGLDVVLLIEAESADEARERGERRALAAAGDDQGANGLRLQLVRAEPAFGA